MLGFSIIASLVIHTLLPRFDTDMPDKNVKVNNLTIPGCDAAPCVFKKGQNATLTFSFTPSGIKAGVTPDSIERNLRL